MDTFHRVQVIPILVRSILEICRNKILMKSGIIHNITLYGRGLMWGKYQNFVKIVQMYSVTILQ